MHRRSMIKYLIGMALVNNPILAGSNEAQRDPTRPYQPRSRQAVAAPGFTVNAIFVSANRRIAIVNGQRVAVGERVGRATVVAISKNHLTLSIGGKRITARLSHGAARQ